MYEGRMYIAFFLVSLPTANQIQQFEVLVVLEGGSEFVLESDIFDFSKLTL